MNQVEVTAKTNHARSNGMILTGQKYMVNEVDAAELKRLGLVDYKGKAAKEPEHDKLLVSDKPIEKKETSPQEKKEHKAGNVPTAKNKK